MPCRQERTEGFVSVRLGPVIFTFAHEPNVSGQFPLRISAAGAGG